MTLSIQQCNCNVMHLSTNEYTVNELKARLVSMFCLQLFILITSNASILSEKMIKKKNNNKNNNNNNTWSYPIQNTSLTLVLDI